MPEAVLTAPAAPATKPKIGFVSLGCPKNLVDSEVMMGLLHHNGAELTQRAEDADTIVINTCSFIDSAKQESVNTILEMVRHKTEGRAKRIIVAGCLVERYRDEIRANIPEVDAVVGTGELEAILEAAGIAPQSDSPFHILPQDFAQPSIEAHTEPHLTLLDSPTVNETTVARDGHQNIPAQNLVSRAPSAVNQHSHPEHIAPQLAIAQSLAETGTTAGAPFIANAMSGSIPAVTSRPTLPQSQGAGGSFPVRASRLEGDAREQAGRFSREAWDGATAALPSYLYSDETPRILATPRASAYIKIAEGCDHPCSFCIIPQLRGKFRSRRMGSIIAEAQNLIAQGVRELTLIGQDTTCYGEDFGLSEGLAQFLEALAPLPGLRWLRFLYTYPNKVTTRLLETMARHDTIAKYLDVPLQHASAPVLKLMKRGGNAQIFLDLIAKARRIVPGIVIRTSFIVGFPGETEADFQVLCDFVQPPKSTGSASSPTPTKKAPKPSNSTPPSRFPSAPSKPAAASSCASSSASPSRPSETGSAAKSTYSSKAPAKKPTSSGRAAPPSTPPRSTATSSSTISAPTKTRAPSSPAPSTAPSSPNPTTTT